MYQAAILFISAMGLISCADTFPDITDDIGDIPTPDESTNDSFFNADDLPSAGSNGSLGPSDKSNYYRLAGNRFNSNFNGTLTFTLNNLSGNVDIEVFDSNLNLISWSKNLATESEEVVIWYDAILSSDLDTKGLHFVKVFAVDANTMNYTLSYSFN